MSWTDIEEDESEIYKHTECHMDCALIAVDVFSDSEIEHPVRSCFPEPSFACGGRLLCVVGSKRQRMHLS
jgi:hypothetical protein